MKIEQITRRARLGDIEHAWWTLWRACGATPFQSPAWLLPWWDAFAPGELLTLAVWHEAQLVGLCPSYIDAHSIVRSLGVSISDYLDVLIDPAARAGATQALNDAMTQLLATTAAAWEFHDLRPDASALGLAPDARGERDIGAPCPVLSRSASGGTLMDAIPTRKRRKLRMAHNRAKRAGDSAIIPADEPTLSPVFEALVRLHGERWSAEGGGVLRDPRTLAFHRAALPQLLRADLLDLHVCKIGEAIAGVYYGLRDRTRAYAYLGGYDPQHAALSPGSRLMAHAIGLACATGAQEFHFLRGDEPYKYEWGALDIVNQRQVFRAHPAVALV